MAEQELRELTVGEASDDPRDRLIAALLRYVLTALPVRAAAFAPVETPPAGADLPFLVGCRGVAAVELRAAHRRFRSNGGTGNPWVPVAVMSDPALQVRPNDLAHMSAAARAAFDEFLECLGLGLPTVLRVQQRGQVTATLSAFPAARQAGAGLTQLIAGLQPLSEALCDALLWAAPGRTGDGSLSGQLTPREREIAQLVAKGATNNEIAAVLVLSPRTIKRHLERIFAKLGLTSRVQLAVRVQQEHERAG